MRAPTDEPKASGSSSAAAGAKGDGTLKIGTLLPQTGSLAFLGPPEFAGVDLAVKDINDAGGVNGKQVEVTNSDSGDTSTDIASQSVDRLLSNDVDAIVGAASSSVSLSVIDKITGAGVVQISPANTSDELTNYADKDLYFRTAPPDVLQGRVLGDLILADGNSTVGILALQDSYGTGLAEQRHARPSRAVAARSSSRSSTTRRPRRFADRGRQDQGRRPRGHRGHRVRRDQEDHPRARQAGHRPGRPRRSTSSTATSPTTRRTSRRARSRASRAPSRVSWPATSSRPASPRWTRSSPSAPTRRSPTTPPSSSPSPPQAAGDDSGASIASKMQEVSAGGEKCTSFKDCLALLEDDKDIDYDGVSGPVEFNEKGDPSEADGRHLPVRRRQHVHVRRGQGRQDLT